jgi:hypothetical protein
MIESKIFMSLSCAWFYVIKRFAVIGCGAFLTTAVYAGSVPLFTCGDVSGLLSDRCNAARYVADQGSWDMYLTGYAWHIDGYDGKRNQKNRYSWGGGAGKHWLNSEGNEEAIFAFVFMDSRHDPEPAVGYMYQWLAKNVGGLNAGVGYFAGISARNDVLHYTPFPIVLPVASLSFGKVTFTGTFLPRIGSLNAGNLAFFFSRISF